MMTTNRNAGDLESAATEIRKEYERRKSEGSRGTTGSLMFESRLRAYDQGLDTARLLPLQDRRVLDLGCANGKWLEICCSRWGAEPRSCVGVDLREDVIKKWRAENPGSEIQIHCQSAHKIDFEDYSFDIVHHSMMLSSVPDRELSSAIVQQMWRVLAPGGCIVSYDFWINPTNKKTVGIGLNQLKGWFPEGRIIFRKKITLLPPLTRLINKLSQRLPIFLERLRFLNTHVLVVIQKDSA